MKSRFESSRCNRFGKPGVSELASRVLPCRSRFCLSFVFVVGLAVLVPLSDRSDSLWALDDGAGNATDSTTRSGTLVVVREERAEVISPAPLNSVGVDELLNLRFEFQEASGQTVLATSSQRWFWSDGVLEPAPRGILVMLVGGNSLVAQSLRMSASECSMQTRNFGECVVPRSAVIGVLLQPRFELRRRLQQLERLDDRPNEVARVWLTGGDWIDGSIRELSLLPVSGSQPSEPRPLTIETGNRTVVLEPNQVELIGFASPDSAETLANESDVLEAPYLEMGTSDGSWLRIRRIEGGSTDTSLKFVLAPETNVVMELERLKSALTLIRCTGRGQESGLLAEPEQAGHVPLLGSATEPSQARKPEWWSRGACQVAGRWSADSLTLLATSTLIYKVPDSADHLDGWLAIPDQGNASPVVAQVFVMNASGEWQQQAALSETLAPSDAPRWFQVDVQGAQAIAINVSQPEALPPAVRLHWLDLRWSGE